jgi:uncharacterized repeat protein (TIGR01451 family)
MQLGITPDVTNVRSYSSIRQLIMVQPNAATVTLRWWQWAFSDEGTNANPGSNQDRFEIIALTPGGNTLRVIHRTLRNDSGWISAMVDVTELAGKSFYLYFNLYNDGHGGRSWIFLDTMMLEVCPGSGPIPGGPNMGGGGPWQRPGKGGPWMPMTQTPTPTPTLTMTTTATPTFTPTPTPTPTMTVTPTVSADLSLAKSVTPTQTTEGGTVVFTLVITNSGPMSATNVTVSDDLPNGYSFVSSSGNYSDVTGIWTIGTLTNGVTSTLQITATLVLTESAVYTNYAQVWTSDQFDPDSTPGDNSTTQDDDDIAVVAPEIIVEPVGLAAPPQIAQAQPASTPAPNAAPSADAPDLGAVPECAELVVNGDFESNTGWTMLQGPAAPSYTAAQTFNGSGQAMLLGIVEGDNLASISAIDQVVDLPSDASSIILSFRYFPLYEAEPGPGDLQYVDLYNVVTGQFAGRALGTQANDRTWLTADYDLTMQGGQSVRLVMAVNNDGTQGRSAMVVDNVSITACDFGDLVNPAIVPTPDPALGVSNRPVSSGADQSTVLLAGRETESAANTWLARLSALGVLVSVAGVIAFAVMVVIGTLRQP